MAISQMEVALTVSGLAPVRMTPSAREAQLRCARLVPIERMGIEQQATHDHRLPEPRRR